MSLLDLQNDPAAFRDALLIDTDSGPRPFGECVDPWQQKDFQALDPGWRRAVGQEVDEAFQRAWLERPRGHSKSADIATMAAWALFASRRRLSLIGCAADQDQARLLRDAIGRLVWLNPWLSKLIEVQNYRVVNTRTESTLDIIASDAKSSYGLTPDGIICDEISNWAKRDLWDSMLSSAAKRSNCILVVITNAGLMDDWQYKTREAIRQTDNWYFSRLDGPQASWITPEILEEQKALLPPISYAKLWLNQWGEGGADWLPGELIDAAFDPLLQPESRARNGVEYVCGIDLGVTRDASAVVCLSVARGRSRHGQIRLAHTKIWRPTKGNPVNLQDVEDTLRDLHDKFKFRQLNYDPWQARHMASRLQAVGLGRLASGSKRREALPMVEVPQTPKTLQQIATTLIEAFNDRRVTLYDDPDLKRDLHKLRIEERANNSFRLVSPRDELGHGDMASAFGFAMLAAAELAGRRAIRAGAVEGILRDRENSKTLNEKMADAIKYRENREAEMNRLAAGGYDYSGNSDWKSLMRLCGRM